MKIAEIIQALEKLAPLSLQESYDNAGLIIGNKKWECTGIICSLDATEKVVEEAVAKGCNLVVAHHPIIFSGLKKLNGNNYIEKTVIAAIKNDIAIYAIHTNLDNIIDGVSKKMADKLGLVNTQILVPKKNQLQKLYSFVPKNEADKVRDAIFAAGAGVIGNYSECSFNIDGIGTFKAGENTNAFVGEKATRHYENEIKLEIIYPIWLKNQVINALLKAHPYEEVAYDIIALENEYSQTGSGLIGSLPKPVNEIEFFQNLSQQFNLQLVKHTNLLNKPIQKVAVCGGAGSFLIKNALAANADIFITGDIKYHEFFDANDRMVIADIGHWESEQFTIELLMDILQQNFPNFAVLKTSVKTNPVQYFINK